MQKIFQHIILIMCSLLFITVFIFSFIYNSNVFYDDKPLLSILFCILILFVWLLIYYFTTKKIKNVSRKKIIIFLISYFLIVLAIQIFTIKQLSVNPSWDFGVVFYNAKDFVLTGTRSLYSYPEYFQLFPNNIMLFFLLVIFIKIGLIFNIEPLISGYIMNILFIDLSIFFLYLTIKNKINIKGAIFGLIITLFFLPIFLYTPIIYSDTLSLFIPILFVYLYSKIQKNDNKRNIIIFLFIGIALFLGKELKITSLIIFVAITIKYLINHFEIKKFFFLVFSILIFLICEISFKNFIVDNKQFQFKVEGYENIPVTHWIMMGVEDIDSDNTNRKSYGGYNEKDYELTKSYHTKKEAMIFNINEYMNRVKKMGILGYLKYLIRKAVNIWTDGYYYSNIKLLRQPNHQDSLLYYFLFINPVTVTLLNAYSQGVSYAFILIVIIGAFIKLKSKNYDLDYLRLTLIGLFIFFLLWENRSRYIFNYIPVFVLIIVNFYYIIYQKYEKMLTINFKNMNIITNA